MKTDKIVDHIVGWLKKYLNESKLKGFVVGVSGGIDSAVTSTLCSMTGKPVIALNMPIHQAPDQESLSDNHIQWLTGQYGNATGHKIDLTPVFQSFQNTLPATIQDDLSMANTRSRIRMVSLYAFATHHRYLVAGTGNKVEDFGVGFYTKYGDGGVDISPIADLLKSEVYEIGKSLGIIDSILNAPPTDGLWQDNRTDESQIGASYAELEWAMRQIDRGTDITTMTEKENNVIKIYEKFHSANKHKMEAIPVCIIPDMLK